MRTKFKKPASKRIWVFGFTFALASSLVVPAIASAEVLIDDQQINEGVNEVGGGTATWIDQAIDMVNIHAEHMSVEDENLTLNFNGGNDIEVFDATGSSNVEMNFACENDVEDIDVRDNATATINANGHNEFEEVEAFNNANVTINVTGENEFETIHGYDNANITVQGTDCQKKDIVKLTEEGNFIYTMAGDLNIDHVTIDLESTDTIMGSDCGNVSIDTSKISAADNTNTVIGTGTGTMDVRESVIDIQGSILSIGTLTIDHSDVKVTTPESGSIAPYHVWSATGINLIREKNGEVKETMYEGRSFYYVDTEDDDKVDLKADGDPAYYKCKGEDKDSESREIKGMPKTAGPEIPIWPVPVALASMAIAALAARRRRTDM